MIIGTVRILPPPGGRGAVIEALQSVQRLAWAQPGCAACDVFDEQGSERAVVLIERWDTQEAFEAYVRSDAYRRVIAAIELSGSQPTVSFEHADAVAGLELIERLRNPQSTTATGQKQGG